jgi:SLOG in TRPM, prokaryote
MMSTQKIYFPHRQALCVSPTERANLAQAISELGLKGRYPVIVLIGGEIDEQQADATRRAIQSISKVAENMRAVVICGGTDMGVMAEIGQIKSRNGYKFALIGVAPEELVTWSGGPRSTKFLWWGKQRWQLESHYSHFILVPGSRFGDESPWIVDTATILSKDHQSVTILINGGEVSRKDIELSLKNGRPVIALSRTGRLADELARQPERDKLITVIPANAEQRIVEAIQAALTINKRSGERVAFQVGDRIGS